MKRTPAIKLKQVKIRRALLKLRLREGLTVDVACKVVAEWLKMRAEASIPKAENLSDSQLRAIFCNIKMALDRATDAILKAPKNARHEIAIEFQSIPRRRDRVAVTYPDKGMLHLIRVAQINCDLSESISRTLAVYASKGGPIRNRGDEALLLDLAELFEWLTGVGPTRKTKSHKHVDAGKPFGEFYEFTRVFWFAYHKSYRGLDAALKTWATQRNKGARKSQFLGGLLHEHPEWQ